jgi:protein SCO1/2
MRPRVHAPVFLALLLAAASPAFAQTAAGARHTAPAQDAAPLMPRYLLTDPQGRAVVIDDFRGRFQLVSFGFVSCPDVCPTTLLEFKQVLELLGREAQRLQPIFITVDPERDTRAVLRDYTAAFDPRILGLTGSPELIRRAADSFRIQYEKVREPGAAPENYTMNHTAGMVLLDGQGRFVARFTYAMPAAEIVQRIRAAMGADGAR